MTAYDRYLDVVSDRLRYICTNERNAIERAARSCADSIANGGVAWVFGAGHSAIMALEAYPRIGGVLGFVPMVELSLLYFTNVVGSGGLEQTVFLERVSGLAEAILRSHEPRAGDSMIIYSSSGLEVLPLEMALGARARGLSVIGVTSVEYSQRARLKRGLKEVLADRVDVVIDNSVPAGDAVIELEGVGCKVGPLSTILNVAIMDCISIETASHLVARGIEPVVFQSPHFETDGMNAYRDALNKFRRLISRPDKNHANEPLSRSGDTK